MKYLLESERLILRWFIPEDFELSRHLDIDEEVKKFIGPALEEDKIKTRFEKAIILGKVQHKLGKWMAVEKETGKAIGWFVLTFTEDTSLIEIGYRFKKEFWGKGYATEMSKVLLKHGFETCNLEKIIGVTSSENIASQKVLLKIGLRYEGIKRFYNQDCMYYELTQTEFKNLQTKI